MPLVDTLTPTEAEVLRDPGSASGKSALRTALLHLAATGYLRAESRPGRSWSGTKGTVRRGASTGVLPDHLAAVMDALFPPGKPDVPLAPTEIMRRLQGKFGYDYGGYLTRHVRPLLVSRGLVEEEEYRWLGLITRRRYRHTAAGAEVRGEIEAVLGRAAEVAALLPHNPARAAGLAASLGGIVLIADGLRPHIHALATAARSSVSSEMVPSLELEEEERDTAWLEAADLLTAVDWAAALDVVDSFGDATDGGADGGDGGDGGGE